MAETLALIGMGLMGSAMAPHWLRAGYAVRGYDPDPDRCAEHEARGGVVASSVAEAVAGASTAVLSLPNSDVARVVCLGAEGIATTGPAGLLVIDTTTGRPADATTIADGLAAAGIRFVDATLSGNSPMAVSGDLVVIVGGDAADVSRARPVLEAIGRSLHHAGGVGAGARMKLIVNQVLGIHRAALGEALVVAEKAGIDLGVALEILVDSAAYSKAMDMWGLRMVEADHYPPGSRIRQSHKDSRLITAHADEVGATAGLAGFVRELLVEAESGGLSDADNSAAIEVLRRRAGIGRIAR
jgi:2-hydroxy-3-oxopropionate reductase